MNLVTGEIIEVYFEGLASPPPHVCRDPQSAGPAEPDGASPSRSPCSLIFNPDAWTKMGKLSVDGVFIRVPLLLLPDARVGDRVLVESGVAIAVVKSE
jgi:HupF/HypC family